MDGCLLDGYPSIGNPAGKSSWYSASECSHLNNKHKYEICGAAGYRKQWKRYQVQPNYNGVHYRIWKRCDDHPGGKPDY